MVTNMPLLENENRVLPIQDVETDAKLNKKSTVAASTWGKESYVGPILGVGIEVDYGNIVPALYDAITGKPVSPSMRSEILASMPVTYATRVSVQTLNDIRDNNIASVMATYKAMHGTIWHVFSNKRMPEVLITGGERLQEVVRNPMLSQYTNNNKETPYIVRSDWSSIKELVPHAELIVGGEDYLAILATNAIAKILFYEELNTIKDKYVDYDIQTGCLSLKHAEALSKYGLTEHHRIYMPEINKYGYNNSAILKQSGVTDKPKSYKSSFVITEE